MKARGFSLVEVLVAMAVLATGLLGTVALITLSINKSAYGRQATVAQQLAADLLEQLRAEVRFDYGNGSPATPDADDVWKAQVLPHEIQPADAAGIECDGDLCCQPPGHDDGVAYDYGPYPFRREGNVYFACYSLRAASDLDAEGNQRTGIPAGSAETVIRILWPTSDTGWRSWSVADLLVRGT